jgi:hypothetical protein
MMLVSSSGWAHSPSTSSLTAFEAVYRSAADAVAVMVIAATATTRNPRNRFNSAPPLH